MPDDPRPHEIPNDFWPYLLRALSQEQLRELRKHLVAELRHRAMWAHLVATMTDDEAEPTGCLASEDPEGPAALLARGWAV